MEMGEEIGLGEEVAGVEGPEGTEFVLGVLTSKGEQGCFEFDGTYP